MKHFKFSIAWLAMFALIFTSCSKDEVDAPQGDQELIEISFRSLLNDFNDQNKQATPQECREGTPAYVWVGITDDDGNYVGDDGGTSAVNLVEIALKYNTSLEVWETHYSEELALPAGDYHLQHFIVYSADHQVLWVAPRAEGSFADYVDDPLPQPFTLAAGTKPYISVDVLCFISRSEEAYGYVFFDINLNRVENSYCLFVNFCPDDNGREVPAHFMVEVWTDGFGGDDEVILSNDTNIVNTAGEWPAASVLCFAVPDIGDGVYYARVSILDTDYYNADPEVNYVEFTFTQDDIDAQELEVPAYHHIRYGCPLPPGDPCTPGSSNLPGDTNNDCVVDCKDTNTCQPGDCEVPGDTNGDCIVDCRDTNTCASDGCGDTAFMYGDIELNQHYNGNNWGWGLLIDGVDAHEEFYDEENDRWVLPFWAGAGQNDTSKAWRAGDVYISITEGDPDQLHVEIHLYDGVTVEDTHFWFNDEGEWPESRAPGQFDLHKDSDLLGYSFDILNDGHITLIVHAGEVCHDDF